MTLLASKSNLIDSLQFIIISIGFLNVHRAQTDFTQMNFILNVEYLFNLGLLDYRFLEIIKSRQAEGIARARERNANKGRQANID